MRPCSLSLLLLIVSFSSALGQMKVVCLHPLMADLAHQIGGEHVQVVSLMRPTDDPHRFNPPASVLHQTRDAKIYLASGMSLETYLDKLRSTLGDSAILVEVGKTLPARETHELCDHSDHEHQHTSGHDHRGHTDPHWWHRVQNMQRASDLVADCFAGADPHHAAHYRAHARRYQAELARLHSWIKRELISIPPGERKLLTAHDSFGYFCDEYGFQSLSIKGLNKAGQPSTGKLADIISTIRRENIKAVFAEQRANPKALEALARETGIKMGGTLIADGSASYVEMMEHNVRTIVAAIKP